MSEFRQLLDLLIELEDQREAAKKKAKRLRRRAEKLMGRPNTSTRTLIADVSKSVKLSCQADSVDHEVFSLGLRISGLEKHLRRMVRA